ncbi:Hypothetical protein SMAX5B_018916 [Scophthalmus maximus]|uniref:Uncharacterized protein n=1 Tax=Scophthalmus maximus TaxID=52904 RepID=A0A2U9C501_SCOMX|nr:Hypothetical protein SMAX5B_018916 [Scophthalmus maximus]
MRIEGKSPDERSVARLRKRRDKRKRMINPIGDERRGKVYCTAASRMQMCCGCQL